MRAWMVALVCSGCSSRPAGPAGVSPGPTFPVGHGPRAVTIGDLDGDGDLDVVVAESGAERISILLNDGRAAFSVASLPAGRDPSDVRLVDADHDGDLDVLVVNHETSMVTVFENDGRARFDAGAAARLDSGSRPHHHGAAVADFDGDGLVDVAVDSVDDDAVKVFFGREDGGFGEAQSVPVCDVPYYKVGAADVSGDGVADLLVPCQRARTLAVVVARGRGALVVAAEIALPQAPWVAVGGDLDGDGRAEIAVVLDTAAGVWRGDVAGGFAPVPGSPFTAPGVTELAIGDVDGDGTGDLAIGAWDASEVVVLLGGSFARRTLASGRRPVGLAIADLDGDGRGEVVAASNLGNEVTILRLPR